MTDNTTIAAIATPPGNGGIAVIRISGPQSIDIVQKLWHGKALPSVPTHTAHFGTLSTRHGEMLDECVVTVFRSPRSFTGEDIVELSVHGSPWLQQQVLNSLMECGATAAGPGEFSKRAFLNGKIDLTQAEAIADIIAADSHASHRMATTQLKGSLAHKLDSLREQLVTLASLLELELDFSEEDVEFADRGKLMDLCIEALQEVGKLRKSFGTGNALKEGVPVAIAGVPNAGKSSLLNVLLEDDRAIVSAIPGTTRDIIEDSVEINGIRFRFIDTAGLRNTEDEVEKIGIERAKDRIGQARILLWVYDVSAPKRPQLEELEKLLPLLDKEAKILYVSNKTDLTPHPDFTGCHTEIKVGTGERKCVSISTITGTGIQVLKDALAECLPGNENPDSQLMVTNVRHYEALMRTETALERTAAALSDPYISPDLTAQDLREAIHHLGTITGAITPATLLTTIFSRFCIGK